LQNQKTTFKNPKSALCPFGLFVLQKDYGIVSGNEIIAEKAQILCFL